MPGPGKTTVVIDPAALAALREFDPHKSNGLAVKMMQPFVATAHSPPYRIEYAFLASDSQAWAEVAHTLKSASANVGVQTLSALNHRLEMLGALRQAHMQAVTCTHEILEELAT